MSKLRVIDLCRKSAIVTGASSGIGAATAILFSNLGAEVILTGRNKENLQTVAAQCVSKNHIIVGDMANEQDCTKIFQESVSELEKLDILVNNAGIQKAGSIEVAPLSQYDEVMNINVRSMFQMTQLAVPHLTETKGCIVNVSSVSGLRAFPNLTAYCVSKAAVDQLTRCCALDLAPKKIRVNAINPGVVVTEIHKRAGMDEQTYAKFLERSADLQPLGRCGQPQDVAESIAFLASDAASFITGVTMPLDGGRHAMCPR